MRKTLKMSYDEMAPERAGFITCAILAYNIEREDVLRMEGARMRRIDALNRALSAQKVSKKEALLIAKYAIGLTNSATRDIISYLFD